MSLNPNPFHVYVGYDVREHLAWLVCESTLYRPLSADRGGPSIDQPVQVHPLAHKRLREAGLFDRTWRVEANGQMVDEQDGRPFSTEFSHSRFLVPALAAEATAGLPEGKKGWAMFVDCDFMFRRPVTDILRGLDPKKAVYVVKHDFARVAEGKKMDGCIQERYFRKLWSSLVLWNLDHPRVQEIDWVSSVEFNPGSALHAFRDFSDDEIGALDETWNTIPGHSRDLTSPAAVHWSLGGPWMEDYAQAPFSDEWNLRLKGLLTSMTQAGSYRSLRPLL